MSTSLAWFAEHAPEVAQNLLNHWHRIAAWGRWVRVLEEFGKVNLQIALEGKLITRFYYRDGVKQFISEVEVNDLVIMS